VKLRTGDCLLVRTGYYRRRKEKEIVNPEEDGTPSLHPSCMQLLH
jgi:hypothetical protein